MVSNSSSSHINQASRVSPQTSKWCLLPTLGTLPRRAVVLTPMKLSHCLPQEHSQLAPVTGKAAGSSCGQWASAPSPTRRLSFCRHRHTVRRRYQSVFAPHGEMVYIFCTTDCKCRHCEGGSCIMCSQAGEPLNICMESGRIFWEMPCK